MSYEFHWQKKKPTEHRKLPLLPRFGFYVELGGWAVTFKKISVLETLLNLASRGVSKKILEEMDKEQKKQLAEIQFPKKKHSDDVMDTSYRTLSSLK